MEVRGQLSGDHNPSLAEAVSPVYVAMSVLQVGSRSVSGLNHAGK